MRKELPGELVGGDLCQMGVSEGMEADLMAAGKQYIGLVLIKIIRVSSG